LAPGQWRRASLAAIGKEEKMKTQKEEYCHYLQSTAWQATRERRLQAAGHQCEFRPEIGWTHDPVYGERCEATVSLDVHHKDYSRLGCEEDSDLEVLCRLDHLVRHVVNTDDCELCGNTVIVEERFAIELVERAIDEAGDVERVSLADLDVPTLCDHCVHVLESD
jgi:hypothetical protein